MKTQANTATNTQIQRVGLTRIVRLTCISIVIVAALLFLLSLPSDFLNFRDSVRWGISYEPVLNEIGISRDFFALYFIIWSFLSISISCALAFIVYQRRTNDWMAMLVTVTLVTLTISIQPSLFQFLPILGGIMVFVANTLLFFMFYLFPDGNFVPRWTRWLFIGVIPYQLLYAILVTRTWTVGDVSPELYGNVYSFSFVLLGLGVAAQVYRYRKVANYLQKQQTKWVVLGLVGALTGVLIFFIPQVLFDALKIPSVFPQQTTYALPSLLAAMIGVPIIQIGSSLVPFSIGISIVRYRLWDLNLVINRSIVFGVVTIFLVSSFGFIFVLAQGILTALNISNTVAVAISALAVGGLFNPTRSGIQNFVDRRIFRFAFNLDQANAGKKIPDIRVAGEYTGRILKGYTLQGVLGRGGMGEVYFGKKDDQTVAIKILPPNLAEKEEFVKRFQREAIALQALDSPYIVKLIDTGEEENLNYLILEFIEGETLGDALKKQGIFDWEIAAQMVKEIAQTLHIAHQHGIVHRDIKPSNIMLRLNPDQETTQPIVMDFGVAQLKDAHTRFTGSGAIGTIDYMAPEQIMTAKTVDHRADIYSLGVVFYEMVIGEKPFVGSPAQVLFAHLQQPVPDPYSKNDTIPHQLADILLCSLAKNADDRFPDALVFAERLQHLLKGNH